jgi:hypothetical protein
LKGGVLWVKYLSNRDEIEKEIAELELEIDGNTVKMEQK